MKWIEYVLGVLYVSSRLFFIVEVQFLSDLLFFHGWLLWSLPTPFLLLFALSLLALRGLGDRSSAFVLALFYIAFYSPVIEGLANFS